MEIHMQDQSVLESYDSDFLSTPDDVLVAQLIASRLLLQEAVIVPSVQVEQADYELIVAQYVEPHNPDNLGDVDKFLTKLASMKNSHHLPVNAFERFHYFYHRFTPHAAEVTSYLPIFEILQQTPEERNDPATIEVETRDNAQSSTG